MKIENFETVKSKMAAFEKHQSIINELKGQISVIITDNGSKVMTIGAWPTCEHPCAEAAINFVAILIDHYQSRLEKLHAEILEL